jgi:hypothetical protein
MEAKKDLFTFVHAETTIARDPRVGSNSLLTTQQRGANSRVTESEGLANRHQRPTVLPQSKRELSLFFGQLGFQRDLLGLSSSQE